MGERQNVLVRIDAGGAVHPVGRAASRAMRDRRGDMRLLPTSRHAVVMRSAEGEGEGDEATAQADGKFWISGEIIRHGLLWDLIATAGQGGWTGELAVVDADSQRSVFFEGGAVVGASSSSPRERLGEVLFEYGVLSREQIAVIADAVTPQMRFGEAAVALGYLTQERLFEVIGRQVEEIMYATMQVSSGAFYFIDGFAESRLPFRFNFSIQYLLMEGARRMDEIEHFRAHIPSGLHVPTKVAGAAVAQDNELYPVFEAIDGDRSVDDIGRALRYGSFETTRAVFQLLQANMIALRPPRPTGPEAVVMLFNEAMALVISKVDEVDGGDEIREQLTSFAAASGVYDTLFDGAGPSQDGTLDAAKVASNIVTMVGEESAHSMLTQWLYEYASFAMFIAEPLLRSTMLPTQGEEPTSEGAQVSRRVAELLAPLAPESP